MKNLYLLTLLAAITCLLTLGCPAGWNETDDDDDDDNDASADDDDDTGDDDTGDDDTGDDDTGDDDTGDDDTGDDDTGDDDTGDDDTGDDDTAPADNDGDGYLDTVDCDDNDPDVNPGADEVPYDGVDNDCDDGDLTDVDGDGFDWEGLQGGHDCDDEDPDVYPGAEEIENGVDDNCNGLVDDLGYPCNNEENEPNDTWQQTDSISANDEICGIIDDAGDMDWFSIGVTAWTQVDFELTGQADGSQISAVVALWDDDGVTLLAEDIGGDASVSGIFPYNGTFYLSVNDQNPANAGWDSYYTLNTYESSPCDSIEIESNDEVGLADTMVAWGTHCGESTHCDILSCDNDYWSFYVFAGETWTFDVDALDVGSLLAAELRLFDTDGSTELATDENMPLLIDPEITYTFGTTGTYYIEVSADWYYLNSLGPYLLYVY